MPDYFTVIEQPMDFSKIHEKVSAHEYDTLDDLQADFNLMCNNALLYNAPCVPRPRLRSSDSCPQGHDLRKARQEATRLWCHRLPKVPRCRCTKCDGESHSASPPNLAHEIQDTTAAASVEDSPVTISPEAREDREALDNFQDARD